MIKIIIVFFLISLLVSTIIVAAKTANKNGTLKANIIWSLKFIVSPATISGFIVFLLTFF